MRYLTGFCSWSNSRNYIARLEYIDLYDAVLKTSNYCVAPDVSTSREVVVDAENVLPAYSFLQCYNLKTLILPRTLKEVRSRALQQCETMETLVLATTWKSSIGMHSMTMPRSSVCISSPKTR